MAERTADQRTNTVSLGSTPSAPDDDVETVSDDELIAGAEDSAPSAAPRFSSPRISQRLPRLSLPSDDLFEGQVLAHRYRVERVISRTSHELVIEAVHLELGQRVLLRRLSTQASTSPEAVARFQRGAKKAREMRSEHAERVVDFGRLDSGCPYRAVELPRGPSLAEILRVRGALPISEAVDIVLTACDPVAEAHASGVVHRCLTTSNIFVERRSDGSPLVRVLDFGVSDPLEPDWVNGDGASPPGVGASAETLRYASPEQIRSPSTVDGRTDVWALGAILYELVAGAPLFQADGALTLLAMIAADAPTPLGLLRADVPPELEELVLSCLEKDPGARPRSVVELVLALTPYASVEAQPAAARVARIVMRTTRPPPLPLHGPASNGMHAPPSSRALVRSSPPPRPLESRREMTATRADARGFAMLFAGAAIGLAAALLAPRLTPAPGSTSSALPVAPATVVSAAIPPVALSPLTPVATSTAVAPRTITTALPESAIPAVAPQPRTVAPAPVAGAPRPVAPASERRAARSAPESRESADAPKARAETKTASADDLFGGLD